MTRPTTMDRSIFMSFPLSLKLLGRILWALRLPVVLASLPTIFLDLSCQTVLQLKYLLHGGLLP